MLADETWAKLIDIKGSSYHTDVQAFIFQLV